VKYRLGWIQLRASRLLQYWGAILRASASNSYAHADGNCHRNTYANCDTDVYAETNTYAKGSSDSERSANTAPAPIKVLFQRKAL
jgi:hypothetical protein